MDASPTNNIWLHSCAWVGCYWSQSSFDHSGSRI